MPSIKRAFLKSFHSFMVVLARCHWRDACRSSQREIRRHFRQFVRRITHLNWFVGCFRRLVSPNSKVTQANYRLLMFIRFISLIELHVETFLSAGHVFDYFANFALHGDILRSSSDSSSQWALRQPLQLSISNPSHGQPTPQCYRSKRSRILLKKQDFKIFKY